MTTLLAVIVAIVVGVGLVGVGFVLGMRERWPLVHGLIIWFSKRWLNPMQMRTAGQPGAYAGVIRHIGRRSGRTYETPVGPIASASGFLIAMPYGRRPDWLRNVLASGEATIRLEGRSYSVDQPEVVPMKPLFEHFSARDRSLMRLLRTDECLRLTLVVAQDESQAMGHLPADASTA
jgi:deazaflavin-dependent oxidoreductase (nitroreductase family)